MGKWLNFIKNGFKHPIVVSDVASSTDTAGSTTPSSSSSIGTPNSPIVVAVSPHVPTLSTMSLLPLVEQMRNLSLFEPIGEKFVMKTSDTPSISLELIHSILSEGDILLTKHTASLASLPPYQQYVVLVDEMMHLPPLDDSLTHDNLIQSNLTSTLQKLTNYYNVLEKLLSTTAASALTIETFNTLTEPLTTISTTFNDLITFFKGFKSREETLRQEIQAYSTALAQIHNQNGGVNIDWGGKRDAFEQKNAELTKRRTAYAEEENLINKNITTLSNQIKQVELSFHSFLKLFREDLTQLLHTSPIFTIQKELETYKALREQILALFPVA